MAVAMARAITCVMAHVLAKRWQRKRKRKRKRKR
jgi:hypothetical protein